MNQLPAFEQYRALMTELGAGDTVAQIDHRVEALWFQARMYYGPDLDDQQYARVPEAVSPDLTAPVDLDVRAELNRIDRQVNGIPPEQAPATWWYSSQTVILAWLGACLVSAILLGATVTGPVVVVAVIPPLATGLVLLVAGSGRVPGWIWALGVAPLSLVLINGKPSNEYPSLSQPPHLLAGMIFVLLVAGFARAFLLAGQRRLEQRTAQGHPTTRAEELAVQRRWIEVSLTLGLFAAMTAGALTGFVVITTIGALLRRRAWTSVVAAGTAILTLLVAIGDARKGFAADWAHPLVIAALAACWSFTIFNEPWRHRPTRTERELSVAGNPPFGGR